MVSALKAGIKTVSGEYIAYVDGDDWIESDMLERMYRKIVEQNVDVVMCGRYEDTGKTHKQVFHGFPEGKYGRQALKEEVYPRMMVISLHGEFFPDCGISCSGVELSKVFSFRLTSELLWVKMRHVYIHAC